MSPLVAAKAYENMIRSTGDEQLIASFEDAIEPPNVINEDTGMPDWYGSDEEAWGEFQAQFQTAQ